jgi:hypothetical protein
MEGQDVREFVRRKKKTFALTVFLLIFLTVEFYYLNCYSRYVPFLCELTFVYVALAVIILNVWYYFSGLHERKNDSKGDMSENTEKPG